MFRDSLPAPHGEGPIKGGLKKLVSNQPGWQTAVIGHLISGRNNKGTKGDPSTHKDGTGRSLACWNIRTMLDTTNNRRPWRRSALIAYELARLNIDIAALSEVRFPEEGSLKENGAGYTLYWSGKPKEEPRHYGVGFMIKNSIASKLTNLPKGISDRIITLRLPISDTQQATLVSVYAPTLLASPEDKSAFYSELRKVLLDVPRHDKCNHPRRFQCQGR